MRKRVKTLFAALFIFALLFSIQACKKSKDVDGSGNPLASIEGNIRVPTPEELQLLMPPEFFLDPDGDGSLATNTHWMMSQAHPASLHIPSSIRANFGEGKKVLFYTRLNTKWLNFTTDIRQMLVDNGYTVEVHNLDTPLPDLSDVDVLAIMHCIGTAYDGTNPGNDRPMPSGDKTKILNFVASGKGFFFTGDYLNSDLPKFNDIAGIFDVKMALNYFLFGFDWL